MNTAVILAGGKSSRFGGNKAFAPVNGKPLIAHLIANLDPFFDKIIISADPSADFSSFGKNICPDIYENTGPLGGLYSGLLCSSSDYAFVTACDMPIVSAALIENMRLRIKNKTPAAVVLGRDGFIEPFHAFYSKNLIPGLKEILDNRARTAGCSSGIYTFLKKIQPEIIKCSDSDIFLNVNTPQDLRKISRKLTVYNDKM